MEKKTQQINLKVTYQMRQQLETICKYEGVGMAELLRGWIRDRLAVYKKAKTTKEIFEEPKRD